MENDELCFFGDERAGSEPLRKLYDRGLAGVGAVATQLQAKYYEYMRSYSPIDNVREGVVYPKTLIVSGLNVRASPWSARR